MFAAELSDEARRAALKTLKHAERVCWAVTCVALGATSVGLAVAVAGVPLRLYGLVIGLGAAFTLMYASAAWQKHRATDGVRHGPYFHVEVEGWCRPGDGCNYAIFDQPRSAGVDPVFVVRLVLRRSMFTGEAWLCGSDQPSGVAVVGAAGEVHGAGRVLEHERGLDVWKRRHTPTGRFVQRPPEDFRPPGA